MNRETLNDNFEARTKLEEALKINEPLSIAYYLKEELKLLWQQRDQKECRKVFGQWIAKAKASGVKMLQKFANTLLSHRTGIFNWYNYPISSGPIEGFNNKIKVMKRQAYGYRDKEFFKLKIYSLHKTKYVLTG